MKEAPITESTYYLFQEECGMLLRVFRYYKERGEHGKAISYWIRKVKKIKTFLKISENQFQNLWRVVRPAL